ncbi:ABC transporter permease [Xanthomonas sp. MUS 060]|uniref:ABC transporter permease n=1 Tax=Xanthomonas sp. MUS 060 TaxID=1588031 RepID=UPI0006987D85|nr:ABC transporter permease [Xanthomonas sp. MUS 060]
MSVSTGHAFQTAARRLLQRPGHSLLAVAVLGVGLGTVLFLFGLVNGLVLKPMPFPDPDRLVAIGYKTENDVGIEVMGNDDYEQIRNSLKSIEATGIYHVQAADIVVGGVAKRYNGCLLSGQMLAFLGTTPLSGRRLGKSDERPGAPLVALISESLWRNDFAAAKDIIGRNVQINGEAATIVGVMPKGFAFPAIADVWLPTRFPPGTSTDVNVVGKLKPGVALGQARADLETVASAQGKQLRGQRAGRNLTVKPLALSFITEKVRSYAWLMFATSSLVLLLACANIGNLQLVQAMSRQRDLAIRCALGASRGRLLRDQLMESFVLSVAATLVALLIAQLGNDWIAGIFAANGKPPPYFIRFGIDGRMLVFAAIAALFTTAVAGFIPAWRASRTDVQEVLREGGKGSHGGFFARISKALVVFEIALTVILLVGAGTFIQGLERVLETKFGNAIDPERILTARIDLRQNRYPDQASRIRLYDQIGERLRSDPAIVNATLANTIPGALLGSHEYIAGLGQPRPAGGYLKAQLGVVDKHFAETYRLKLIVGRFFDERDAQNPVVVIDSETAALLWPGTDAIGQRIALHPEQENPDILTVIGVVSDLQLDGVSEDSLPSILLPMPLNGTAIQSLSAGQRAKVRNREIGFIFQAFNLIGDLSIFENVELPLVYLEGEQALSRKQRKERVLEVLEQVGIAHRVNHYPAQLSGGQQQRVAVARALVTRPAVLLADEPTGNLDSHNGEAVIALLDQLHRSGSTICMVTHDLRHAKFAQRSIYMFDGRVVDEEMLTSLRRKEEDMIDERLNLARSSRT